MAIAVKLSEEAVNEARRYGSVYSRSTPKQIEYWMNIGKIAEENPDLSYQFIKEILLAKAEAKDSEVSPYTFG
ncbi:ParD-like family protein [Akkermansiaceae bacterium]|nr:ParD-like family protein [Akkermansiaceae bacterium]